MDFYHLNKDN